MFDYSIMHWTAFLTASILLNLSPGPDFAYILAQTVRGGRRAGFAAMAGIWTGAFGHVAMASFGLSALLASSALAFSLIKWAGAAYLVWLGISAFFSGGTVPAMLGSKPLAPLVSIYRQGALVSLLNPKVAIFFLAFLPQFVVPGAGPTPWQLLLHGTLIIVTAAFIEPLLVMGGHHVAARLRGNPRFNRWLERWLGTLLVALGIRLVLQER